MDDIADATVNASENIGSGNLEINQVCRLCNHTMISNRLSKPDGFLWGVEFTINLKSEYNYVKHARSLMNTRPSNLRARPRRV